MKPSKHFLEERLRNKLRNHPDARLLELGCGRAEMASRLLKEFPSLTYVGIEPDTGAFMEAKKNLPSDVHATLLRGFGYGDVQEQALQTPFDFVISLSVLEHVKDLERFLAYAARMTKPGGEVIHLYDLGHSLYPSGIKEWIQTKICSTSLLKFVPETKVARYLATEDVRRIIETTGCRVEEITFHNMRSHVALLKAVQDDPDVMKRMNDFEQASFSVVSDMKTREKLFPSICFWSVKQ